MTLAALARRSVLALALAALAACSRRAPGPNLLLVSVDTLRADRLSCYGGAADAGIAICALGERGVRYAWAFSTAPSTAPSVASILTSRYPSFHGVTELFATTLAPEQRTVAEELAAAGYDTAAVVSNPVLAPERQLGQGFAVYDAEMTRHERNRPQLVERAAKDTTDAALAWLAQAKEPWFLWVHYQDPHGPYEPPNAPPVRDAPGARRLPLLEDNSGRGGIPAYQRLPGVFGTETYEARYRAELDYLDPELSRLFRVAAASQRKLGVLLTADHGEAFGEDGYWFAHGHSLGLEQIHVPLLWRPPEGGAGLVITSPVSNLDVAPTLLAAAGVAPPREFQGRPLPLAEPSAPRTLFAQHRLRVAAISGGLYLARDLDGFTADVPDPVSGGRLYPLPPRSARLPADGRVPAYESADTAAVQPLARELTDFLGPARAAASEAVQALPEETRKQLEALGYLR